MLKSLQNNLNALRIKEVFLMSGFFLIGAFYSIKDLSLFSILKLGIYELGSFFFVISVYAFNAYGGYNRDQINRRLSNLKNLNPQGFLVNTVGFFILFNLCYSFISLNILSFAWLSYVGWLLYSYPKIGWKNIPILGTLIHFFTQLLHFQMGYCIFSTPSYTSFLISVYFALLFSAAHLHHEIIDYVADKAKSSNTNAVFFGLKKTEMASIILFSIAAFYHSLLFIFNVIPILYFLPFFIAYLLQLYAKFSTPTPIKYRTQYRLYYLIAGVIIFLTHVV